MDTVTSTTSTTIDMVTIRGVVELIVDRFDPERVVLFGSYARGDAGRNSDVDLLVEMRAVEGVTSRGNPVRRAIAERFVLPVDVVVRSPDAVEKHRDDPYSLVHHALKEGVVLYERRRS